MYWVEVPQICGLYLYQDQISPLTNKNISVTNPDSFSLRVPGCSLTCFLVQWGCSGGWLSITCSIFIFTVAMWRIITRESHTDRHVMLKWKPEIRRWLFPDRFDHGSPEWLWWRYMIFMEVMWVTGAARTQVWCGTPVILPAASAPPVSTYSLLSPTRFLPEGWAVYKAMTSPRAHRFLRVSDCRCFYLTISSSAPVKHWSSTSMAPSAATELSHWWRQLRFRQKSKKGWNEMLDDVFLLHTNL